MSGSLPETHVRFVPFELLERSDKVLVGRDDGRDWIVLEPALGQLVAELDRGVPVEALDGADALVRQLEAIGFVDAIGAAAAGSRRRRFGRAPRSPWPWRLFAGTTVVALALAVWLFASGRAPLPSSADLIARGVPWPLGVAVLAAALTLTGVLHELAHVVAGRHYGLRPRVRVRAHVLRTDLTAVWALERSLRWRPIAAGMMGDVCVLAVAATAGMQWLTAIVLARLVWQLQLFHRTDLHFVFAALSGALHLRETSGLVLRRSPRLAAFPASEIRAARRYVLLLPLAGATTLALAAWLLAGVIA